MQPDKKRQEQLFGTLLASQPATSRSPLELGVAIGLHVVALLLLVVITRPFISRTAAKFFENITIVVPAEEPVVTIAPPAKAAMQRALPRVRRSIAPAPGNQLTFTPGPITEIPPPAPGPETAEPTGEGKMPGAATLADRLIPKPLDPRLIPGTSYTTPGDYSPAAAVRLRIAQTLKAYNDSVAAEAEAKAKGLDWTMKGKDGERWGVSPGRIHLGSITIPFPMQIVSPPGKRDEINARNRAYAEIEAQYNREIGRQEFKDRVKAIRARKDRERTEKKKPAAPDAPITN